MSHCEHCLFFQVVMVEGPTPGDRLLGHCHRFPPPTGRPTPLKGDSVPPEPSHFPLIKGSDWCGEFRQANTDTRRLSASPGTTPQGKDMRLVISSGEAAKLLGISNRTLYSLSESGEVPRVRIGSRVCYRMETLQAWVASREG